MNEFIAVSFIIGFQADVVVVCANQLNFQLLTRVFTVECLSVNAISVDELVNI